jgi:hypothetical protein
MQMAIIIRMNIITSSSFDVTHGSMADRPVAEVDVLVDVLPVLVGVLPVPVDELPVLVPVDVPPVPVAPQFCSIGMLLPKDAPALVMSA